MSKQGNSEPEAREPAVESTHTTQHVSHNQASARAPTCLGARQSGPCLTVSGLVGPTRFITCTSCQGKATGHASMPSSPQMPSSEDGRMDPAVFNSQANRRDDSWDGPSLTLRPRITPPSKPWSAMRTAHDPTSRGQSPPRQWSPRRPWSRRPRSRRPPTASATLCLHSQPLARRARRAQRTTKPSTRKASSSP